MVSVFNIFGVRGFSLLLAFSITSFAGGSSIYKLNNFFMSAPGGTKENKPLDLSKLSKDELLSKASSIKNSWGSKLSSVKKMMAMAKKNKNIMRTNCLGPKLKKAGFWVGEGKQAFSDLKKGDGAAKKERVEFLVQKITVIDKNVDKQVLEASRCIGDEKFSSGEAFEVKASHPDEVDFDPESPVVEFTDFGDKIIVDTPVNPDWSVELTWPTASPYL